MKTNQVMKREFMDSSVFQRTKDGFFNANSLLDVYNLNNGQTTKRIADFWLNKGTKDFIEELENDLLLNIGDSQHLKTHETTRGRHGGGTWMHPYLFVKFAMWLSPKFELQVIKWVYDNLIEVRNEAGDHYKEMCESILSYYERNKDRRPNPFVYSNEARFLNKICIGRYEGGVRNGLNEKELKLLNALQRLNIKLLNKDKDSEYRRKYILENLDVITSLIE